MFGHDGMGKSRGEGYKVGEIEPLRQILFCKYYFTIQVLSSSNIFTVVKKRFCVLPSVLLLL